MKHLHRFARRAAAFVLATVLCVCVLAPAASAAVRGRAAARAAALAADGAASAADGGKVRYEKFSRIAALLADILIPNLMKEEYFV